MIIGIGTDIVEIDRVKAAMEREQGFVSRVLTPKERELLSKKAKPWEYTAGRFSAKEAISKALGTGIRGFSLQDIEVLNDELGAPKVELKGAALELMSNYSSYKIHLSISHCRDYASAFALLEVCEK